MLCRKYHICFSFDTFFFRARNRNQRTEELQGFITLEEFMLSRQEEECQRNNNFINSTHFTPLNNDHVHFQHQNIADSSSIVQNNGMIYGSPRNVDDSTTTVPPPPRRNDVYSLNSSFDGEVSSIGSRNNSIISKFGKKSQEPSCLQTNNSSKNNNYESQQKHSISLIHGEPSYNQGCGVTDNQMNFSTLDYGERLKPQPWVKTLECGVTNTEFNRRVLRNEGNSMNKHLFHIINLKSINFLS